MEKLSYDLHIHSCLSPCGDDDMTPANIVGMAAVLGLEVIALTDHNSCKNCPAFMAHAEKYGIIGIPGMEINTMEEVHVVCLFPSLEQALEFDTYVSERLMPFPNKEEIFGKQQIMDEEDTVIGTEPYLLINAVDISIDELWDLVRAYGGVMIPAHIDKDVNSLIYNLGFIPPDSQFTIAEVKEKNGLEALIASNPYLERCKILHNSDAHYLHDIQEPCEYLEVESPTIEGVLNALLN